MSQQERKQPNIKPIDGENEIEERIIEVKRVSKKNNCRGKEGKDAAGTFFGRTAEG